MSGTETETDTKNDVLTLRQESLQTNGHSDGTTVSCVNSKNPNPSQNPQSTSTSTSTNESNQDVSAVVTKAKQAAKFLWLLLHAQVCQASADTCPYQGCAETKRLLLHMNTCSATADMPCPTSCDGCQQARKLLAHYRKCRDERFRLRRQNRSKQNSHFCLICTLLKRHDNRISSQNSASSTSSTSTIQAPYPNRNHELQPAKCIPVSSSVSASSSTSCASSSSSSRLTPTKLKGSSITPSSSTTSTSFSTTTTTSPSTIEKVYSPPVNRKKSKIKTVHFKPDKEVTKAFSMPPPAPRSRLRTGSVGSIPTSLLRNPLSLSNSSDSDSNSTSNSNSNVRSRSSLMPYSSKDRNHRQRSESLDESKRRESNTNGSYGNDPTVEFELKEQHQLPFRKRSVSFEISSSICDTIMEE